MRLGVNIIENIKCYNILPDLILLSYIHLEDLNESNFSQNGLIDDAKKSNSNNMI